MNFSAKLVQISDLHLMADPRTLYRGQDVDRALRAVLDHISRHHGDADALLVTGDMVHSGGVDSYRRLGRYLDATGLPWYWLPGNHDDGAALGEAWGEQPRALSLAGWHVLLLDSTARPDGRGAGSLGGDELARLEALESDRPLLLALHHNPVPVGSPWQDAIALGDARAFWSAMKKLEAPVTVLFGHTHQGWDLVEEGVRLLGCPATSVQFRKGTAAPELETASPEGWPGYRWLGLFDTGQVQSTLERIHLA